MIRGVSIGIGARQPTQYRGMRRSGAQNDEQERQPYRDHDADQHAKGEDASGCDDRHCQFGPAVATALIAAGDLETGTLLAGAAAAARDHMDGGWSSLNFEIEDVQTRAVEALGRETALDLMAQGAKLSLDQAIEIAKTS